MFSVDCQSDFQASQQLINSKISLDRNVGFCQIILKVGVITTMQGSNLNSSQDLQRQQKEETALLSDSESQKKTVQYALKIVYDLGKTK